MSTTNSILFMILLLLLAQNAICQNQIGQDILRIEEKLYFYPQEGERELDSLINGLAEKDYDKIKSKLYFLSGVLAYKKAELDSAIVYLQKALVAFVNDEDKLYQAKAQLILGWLAEKIGYWEQSKINYYKVIDLVDENNKREQGLAYLGIARCKHYSGEDTNFELQKGVALLKDMGIKEYHLYAEFVPQVLQNSNSQTPDVLLSIAKKYLMMKLHTDAASVYKGIATYYRQMGELDSAHKYLDEALASDISNYPATSLIPALNQHKGLVYFYQKDYENARLYLNKSLIFSDKYGQEYTKYYTYRCLYKIDTLMGDFKTGFIHLSKANEIIKRNQHKEEKQLVKLMETSLNLMALEEENRSLKSLRNNIILLSLSVVFALLGLYFQHRI